MLWPLVIRIRAYLFCGKNLNLCDYLTDHYLFENNFMRMQKRRFELREPNSHVVQWQRLRNCGNFLAVDYIVCARKDQPEGFEAIVFLVICTFDCSFNFKAIVLVFIENCPRCHRMYML